MSESNQLGYKAKASISRWASPMTGLAVVFVALYLAALTGWLRPMSDLTMIARLEPILFLIFGYYFGLMPSKQNERRSREENERMTKKLEAALRLKDQAQAEREAMEEKIRNANIALRSELIDLEAERRLSESDKHSSHFSARAVTTAINILNS